MSKTALSLSLMSASMAAVRLVLAVLVVILSSSVSLSGMSCRLGSGLKVGG